MDHPLRISFIDRAKANLRRRLFAVGWRRLFIALHLIPVFLLLTQGANAQRIGYVFEINGEWVLSGQSRILQRTDAVPAGGVIRFRKAGFWTSYIVLADRNGKIISRTQCAAEHSCNEPIILPRSIPGDSSLLSRVFGAVMSFWKKAPSDYEAAISRTPGKLDESIASVRRGAVDLSAAFKNKESGEYLLRVVPKGKRHARRIEEVAFQWDSARRSPLLVPKIRPGLYEIQLLSKQDRQRLEPGEEVWVLVVRPGKYLKVISAEFSQVLAETAQWNQNNLEESRRSFLRAYLGYLDAKKKK